MFNKLLFPKRWQSAIAILEDNIFTSDVQRWSEAIANLNSLHDDLNRKTRTPSEERRCEPRFSLSLPVHHRTRGKDAHWRSGESIDVSQNGVRLAIDAAISVGTRLELEIKLPRLDKTIRIQGVVVWTKLSSNGRSTLECGVAFDNLRRVTAKDKIIGFMADRLCDIAMKRHDAFKVGIADQMPDIKRACQIVYQEYLRRGYCKENPDQLHYTYYTLLPDSRTFVLFEDGQMLGTVSLIVDSPCGLPLEHIYPEEIARFRKPGKVLAEVSLLALDHFAFGHKSFTLTDLRKLAAAFRLFRIMFSYARHIGITDIFIAMHPKHKELYSYLTFETAGPVKSYKGAEGNPAVLMRMDVARTVQKSPKDWSIFRYFIAEMADAETLNARFNWSDEDVWEFLTVRRKLWTSIPGSHQEYILSCYPGFAKRIRASSGTL